MSCNFARLIRPIFRRTRPAAVPGAPRRFDWFADAADGVPVLRAAPVVYCGRDLAPDAGRNGRVRI